MRRPQFPTIIRHIKAVLKRAEHWDCTSVAEDRALREALAILQARQRFLNPTSTRSLEYYIRHRQSTGGA